MKSPYENSVFINCPFDSDYHDLFYAVTFAVHDCGLVARCALEIEDSGQLRMKKITSIIKACRYGVHDISRTELDKGTQLPRFNMPLELGLFLGAKAYGSGKQKSKSCLILDQADFRYQKFCSDIAGQDIRSHRNDVSEAIKVVRNWLRNPAKQQGFQLPGGKKMSERYNLFKFELPDLCKEVHIDPEELTYNDYTTLVVQWLKVNPW